MEGSPPKANLWGWGEEPQELQHGLGTVLMQRWWAVRWGEPGSQPLGQAQESAPRSGDPSSGLRPKEGKANRSVRPRVHSRKIHNSQSRRVSMNRWTDTHSTSTQRDAPPP